MLHVLEGQRRSGGPLSGDSHQPMVQFPEIRTAKQCQDVDMAHKSEYLHIIDRKKRRRSSLPLEMDIDLYNDSDHDTKQIKMLHERINRLGPFDRAIILLWLENMSYEEIGAIVGISERNVSVRLYRIKEQLKTMK